ncbi:sn-1-specific diacylglycerol lipase ABHD11-like [Sminthopsis crassicaudata]|uniref:sn-1-specific diacylglycerol lipase ABHD11-like n=1 Tax=Sminthopsis crassicaudata TaxID=9301 RepID=UPI003D694090
MWRWTRTWIRRLQETGMPPVPSQGPSKLLSGSFRIQAMYSSQGPRTVPLSYKLLEGSNSHPPLVLLHGLFGSKIYFESEAKALAEQTGRKVLTIDARNHRDSPSDPDCSYEAMSADLEALLLKLGLAPCVLLGHCMGGKIAMVLALRKPELVERLIPLDISPTMTTAFPEALNYIEIMKSLKIPKELSFSKAQQLANEQLSQSIEDPVIRQYLLNNLMMVNGQYVWKVDSEVLSQQVDKIMDFPQIQGSYSGPTLFLRGANSPLIQPYHYPKIKRLFPQAQILTIPKAGHWIHVDQPQDFMSSILNFLSSKLLSPPAFQL